MTRMTALSSPLLLGFDQVEQMLDRISKSSGDGYPPYNIERLDPDTQEERLRITLAVAGFESDQLDIEVEDSALTIRGAQSDDDTRDYLYRGIAARRFERKFILADGIQVTGAELKNGLLSVDLSRPTPERIVKRIPISARD